MDGRRLQDQIARGLGNVARKLGSNATIYRPNGIAPPISPQTKVLELPAQFKPGKSGSAVSYGQSLWRGIFDTSYSQAGDFLVSRQGTFFVAQQQTEAAVQCILTNRIVSVVRPGRALQGGYSGFFATSGEPILLQWPASLLADNARTITGKAGEVYFGTWTVLLPHMEAVPQSGDICNDDLGAVYNVTSAEYGALGWRLLVRQVSA